MQAGETCPSVFSVVFSSSFNLFGLLQNRALPGRPNLSHLDGASAVLAILALFYAQPSGSNWPLSLGPDARAFFGHWVPAR